MKVLSISEDVKELSQAHEELICSLLVTETSQANPFFELRLRKWLTDSEEVFNFVRTNQRTIVKKVKGNNSEEDLWDLFYELEVGYYFTIDPRTRIVNYQPQNSSSQSNRNPDYLIAFEDQEFYLDVARIRDNQEFKREPFTYEENGITINTGAELLRDRTAKIKDLIFSKLTQFSDLKPNVLFILTESPDFDFESIRRAVYWIGKRIEAKDESYFRDRKWSGSGIHYFLEHWKNLSAIVLKDTFREQSIERIQGASYSISVELARCLHNLRGKGELSKQEYIEERNRLGSQQFAYGYASHFQAPAK